jgi:hypothetical protein
MMREYTAVIPMGTLMNIIIQMADTIFRVIFLINYIYMIKM